MENVYGIFALAIVVLLLLYYYSTSTYGYWKKKSMPFVKGPLPGLGNVYPMLFVKKNMAEMHRDIYKEMADHSMIGFYNLRQPALMVRDPELVKTVLSKNFQYFARNSLKLDEELDPLIAVGPFFDEGDRWKVSRQQLSSAFTPGKLKYMYAFVTEACSQMNEYVNKLIENSNGKVELELKDLFSRYTAEVVASVGFGVDGGSFKSDEDGPFREMGRLMFEPSLLKGLTQVATLFVPLIAKIFRISFMPAKADQFFREVVKDVLKYREKEGIQRADFLQLMMRYKTAGAINGASDQEFNDDLITSHAASFFNDGYETSSITLSFFAYQLAAHPEVQDRVREEVTKVVAKHGGLTYEALQEMTYMDQALNESMRLFPALAALLKICTQETELVGSDGLTCHVTPGTLVVVSNFAIHRDPEYWPDPDKYDPERFSEEEKHSRHRSVYLPFGEGPRICPGMRIALLKIKAAIATVIQSYTWEVSPRTKEPIQLDPNHFLSAAVGGLWATVRRL